MIAVRVCSNSGGYWEMLTVRVCFNAAGYVEILPVKGLFRTVIVVVVVGRNLSGWSLPVLQRRGYW